MKWLLVVLSFVAALGGACTLLDDDPPDGTCQSDQDCFRAQGETCNVETHRCEVHDGGVVDAP